VESSWESAVGRSSSDAGVVDGGLGRVRPPAAGTASTPGVERRTEDVSRAVR
jgi:hypothetical protein